MKIMSTAYLIDAEMSTTRRLQGLLLFDFDLSSVVQIDALKGCVSLFVDCRMRSYRVASRAELFGSGPTVQKFLCSH